ncbi:hypothetical protein QZH41_018373, partial [Actinostola sp. cb2023]
MISNMADESKEDEINPLKRPLVEDYSDGEEEEEKRRILEKSNYQSRHCPYLDTINRHVLDFDFEKLCSISLSHINAYACLICGKYFQGRGRHSHAYTHSVSVAHHVFLNLHTLKFYCLPDNYEVIDSSLDDIKYVLNPTFTKEDIKLMDTSAKMSRAFDGTTYLPGNNKPCDCVVGLNNIKANDYLNVILQAFAFVPPIRNFFLREENYKNIKRPSGDIMFPLVQRYGELIRKIWNPRNFKAHVSPHEMLQAVVLCSKKRFQFTKQGEPVDFLSWFLNALHTTLGGSMKKANSMYIRHCTGIIFKSFQGRMKIMSRKVPQTENEEEKMKKMNEEEFQEKVSESPFLFLNLDIPASPLFKDELQQNIIPQISLFSLLSKFDGTTEKEYKTYKELFIKKFELTKLPPYLMTCFRRFAKNTFFTEKNATVVNFPVKAIDMAEYLSTDPKVQDAHPHTTYDLIANICHEGDPEGGTYRLYVLHK